MDHFLYSKFKLEGRGDDVHVGTVALRLKPEFVLPEMELSCFLLDDLLSCLKEFSSSASPSPHQDG